MSHTVSEPLPATKAMTKAEKEQFAKKMGRPTPDDAGEEKGDSSDDYETGTDEGDEVSEDAKVPTAQAGVDESEGSQEPPRNRPPTSCSRTWWAATASCTASMRSCEKWG